MSLNFSKNLHYKKFNFTKQATVHIIALFILIVNHKIYIFTHKKKLPFLRQLSVKRPLYYLYIEPNLANGITLKTAFPSTHDISIFPKLLLSRL